MKTIFLGGVWEETGEAEIIENSNGPIQFAANILQRNIISGLDSCTESPVTIISTLFIGAFPNNYKRARIDTKTYNHSGDKDHIDYQVGFLNLPLLKHLNRYYHMKKKLTDICGTDEELYVIGYSMTFSIVKTLKSIKQIRPNTKTCLIVPDLPEYMSQDKRSENLLFRLLKRISNAIVYRAIKRVDCFVLLTEQMASRVAKGKPYIVMEGIAPEVTSSPACVSGSTKIIAYTGSTSLKYGIKDLVDAFMHIEDPNLRLVICGAGDGDEYIKTMALQDVRIEHKGSVDVKTARSVQRQSYLLVNPRNGTEEYTKYSFPSKTMEYMASGRPILMYKLQGIPQEYDRYIYYVDEDLETALRQILNSPEAEVNSRGLSGQRFIMERKNPNAQASRILRMMGELK